MILPILKYPHSNLKLIAKPVTEFNDELRKLVDDMFETLKIEPGIGLAATQVDRHIQLFIVEMKDKDGNIIISQEFINAKIIKSSGSVIFNEGCLSFPDIFYPINRFKNLEVQYQDRFGNEHKLKAWGILAVCIQHELDHGNGRLLTDYVDLRPKK